LCHYPCNAYIQRLYYDENGNWYQHADLWMGLRIIVQEQQYA